MQGSTLSVQSVSLFFSARLWATSNSAETYAILYALEWVSLTSRHMNLNLSPCFLTLSVLSTLSAPLSYLIPKSLFNTQSLLNTLSDSKVIHLQWIPGHFSLPGNKLADSLSKAGASCDPCTISLSLLPLISSQQLSSQRLSQQLTPVGDAVFNLVSFNIKFLQCLLISLLSFAPLAVLSLSFTLQLAQHSWHISSWGWSSRDSFMQQLWF